MRVDVQGRLGFLAAQQGDGLITALKTSPAQTNTRVEENTDKASMIMDG